MQMKNDIVLEPAYVLHTRPFRDTSLLVEFFTAHHGRVSGIARSARGLKSRFKGALQLFTPLLISLSGKGDLLQLTQVEQNGLAYTLQGKMLFSGFYLNELLLKLLQRFDPYSELFLHYQDTLQKLQNTDKEQQQQVLRLFEKNLLQQLGYGLQLDKESTGKTVCAHAWYSFDLERGLTPNIQSDANKIVFRGNHLMAIQENNFSDAEILTTARTLMRSIFNALLGNRPLKSRELFMSL